MTPSEVLKLVAGAKWHPVTFSAYTSWPWVHVDLGPEALEHVDPDGGDWVLFLDGAFIYWVAADGERQCYRLDRLS